LSQKTPIFLQFFDENILKILASVPGQGDKIGRIFAFAQWVIAYFEQLIEDYRSIPHTWAAVFIG
jgi:hypothetical protein